MTFAAYMNAQFSVAQLLDFFARVLVASACGACVGLERTKRLKEAGLRTHVIVCFAAALIMIVSKYGFADLTSLEGTAFSGTRGADSARVAAQVVSGISFLGAGVIFKNGSTIRGLTTAAGIWATAGIGLTIGAGMYVMGIFSTAVFILLQYMMHRFSFGLDSMGAYRLQFTIDGSEGFHEAFAAYSAEKRIQIVESKVTQDGNDLLSYDLVLKTPQEITIHDLTSFLRSNGKVHALSYSTIT